MDISGKGKQNRYHWWIGEGAWKQKGSGRGRLEGESTEKDNWIWGGGISGTN